MLMVWLHGLSKIYDENGNLEDVSNYFEGKRDKENIRYY